MRNHFDAEDLVLNYAPEFPHARFVSAGLEEALKSSTGRLPSPVLWAESSRPVAAPLKETPSETDDFSRFRGYHAVVVTVS